MRILFVAARFHTNQIPFVRALQEAGHEVHFDVLFEGVSEDHSLLEPTVIRPALLSRLLMRLRRPVNVAAYQAANSFPTFLSYLRRLRRLRPDVVVVREPNRPFARRAALAARLLGLRIVIYTQGDVHARSTRKKDLLREGLIRSLGATWFSPVLGDPSLPRVHERVQYVPFAADQDRPVKERWFTDDRVRILAIGKFVPRKNHLLLLEAFDIVRRDHAVELTIVGEVSHADHEAHHARVMHEIERRELHDAVTVRTNVPFADVHTLYERHDLFVLASRDEPAGVSILEAMAHGLPVVCSSTSGTRCYVEPGASGEIFRSDDRDDLVATLARLVGDREGLVAMGRRGRTLAETVHHPHAVRDSFMALLAAPSRTAGDTRTVGSS